MTISRKIFIPSSDDLTASLQKALDTTAQAGEALYVAPGHYVCGPLRLPSGTDLYLEEGAVLQFHGRYDCYGANRVDVIAEESDRALILAQDGRSIRIHGQGRIEAPGEQFIEGVLADMGTYVPARHRPRTLVLNRCSDVVISGIQIVSSAMWTVHIIRCEHVIFDGVTIVNDRKMPNTDGIVVDSCRDVWIEQCVIDTADDGVVLKTSRGPDGLPLGECRSVRVSNCRIMSQSCALKLGTESFADIGDVLFEDCKISNSNRALGLFSRDGGRLFNISFKRLKVDCAQTPEGFWGSGEAITATVLDRRRLKPAGVIENVLFEDIDGLMEGAINLVSDKPGHIRNIVLRRVSIRQASGRFNGCHYDMRPTRFDLEPSPDAAGRANAWVRAADGTIIGLVAYPGGMPGVFASNVDNLVLEEVQIDRSEPLPRGFNPDPLVILQGQAPVWS